MNDDEREEIKRHMNVLAEQFWGEVRPIAEAVVGLSQRIDSLERNIEREFEETRAMIKFSYAELDRRLSMLEANFSALEARVNRLDRH